MSAGAVAAFIGLGSNLGEPERQIRRALVELDGLAHSRLTGQSPLYGSRPVGPPGQPDYVNAVAGLDTTLQPHALLEALQAIERSHDRVRGERWGARTLDLDLLLYGERQIDTPVLQVPHPQLHLRAFVLLPLYDLAPDLELPGLGPLADYLPQLPGGDLWRLAERTDD